MNWKYILKNDDYIEEGGKRLGPEGTSGAFTMDMFADSNWYNMLHKLLSFSVKTEEGETRTLQKPTEDAIKYGAQYYLDLLNNLLIHSDYGKTLETASEKYSESTRTFADEHQQPEPEEGSKGKGMMPKRLEHIANSISKTVSINIYKKIRKNDIK